MPDERPKNFIERLPEIIGRGEEDVSHLDPEMIEILYPERADKSFHVTVVFGPPPAGGDDPDAAQSAYERALAIAQNRHAIARKAAATTCGISPLSGSTKSTPFTTFFISSASIRAVRSSCAANAFPMGASFGFLYYGSFAKILWRCRRYGFQRGHGHVPSQSSRDLEREYEQWFSGALRTPPWNTQKICERIVNQYSRNPSGNLSEQTIFSMHQAKFRTYMEM